MRIFRTVKRLGAFCGSASAMALSATFVPAAAQELPAEEPAEARDHEHSSVDDIVVLGRRRIDRVNGSDMVTERMSQASIALDRAILDD